MPIARRLLLRLLPLLLLPLFASCRKAVERTVEKIRFEGIERVEVRSLSAVTVTVRIDNGTGHRLRLDEGSATLLYNGSRVGTLTLTEPAELPARTRSSLATRWRARVADPIALLATLKALDKGDLSHLGVSFSASGHGGPAPVNISREEVPLQEILNTFGITIEDLKNYIR